MVRFNSLPYPMSGICCNRETFLVDIMGFTHAGKTRWGLIFYGIKSKLLDCYILILKDPTANANLYALGQSISEDGIPRQLVIYIHIKLGAGKK